MEKGISDWGLVVHGRVLIMARIERNRQLYYTEGNTVRKMAAPLERPKRPSSAPREEERRERRREHRRSYRKADDLEMSLPYVAFLFVMVIMIVMSCVKYLDMNSQLSENNSKIATLQTKLDTLVTKNDAMEYEINGFIDVDYIIDTALNELGMIVAGKEQVTFYDNTPSEYMNQLNDIPED